MFIRRKLMLILTWRLWVITDGAGAGGGGGGAGAIAHLIFLFPFFFFACQLRGQSCTSKIISLPHYDTFAPKISGWKKYRSQSHVFRAGAATSRHVATPTKHPGPAPVGDTIFYPFKQSE